VIAIARKPESVIRGSGSTSEAPHGNGNVHAANIVRHRGTLLMYYGGQGRDGHDRIPLATSTDRNIWRPQGVVFAPEGIHHVNDPSVVILNSRFYMHDTQASVGVTDCTGLPTSAGLLEGSPFTEASDRNIQQAIDIASTRCISNAKPHLIDPVRRDSLREPRDMDKVHTFRGRRSE